MTPRAKKKQKIHPDRTTTAAYAASQPLFSALRNAISTLDTTKANLTVARDIVQSLHVKIANDDTHNDPDRHDAYMTAAVDAWKSCTDAFSRVFEELVSIAAADPSEGREAGPRHDEFVGLLGNARRARELAEKFSNHEDKSYPVSQDESQDEDQDEAMDESSHDGAEEPEPAQYVNQSGKRPMAASEEDSQKRHALRMPTRMNLDIRYSKTGEKVLWQNGALKVPYETLDSDEKKAWTIIASRGAQGARMKEQNQTSNRQQTAGGAEKVAATDSGIHAGHPTVQPKIEFEDVSAEVEARLKVKAEKRAAEKARKAEKKRKRESGNSFANGAKEDTPEPLEALEQLLVRKPAHKKAKKGADTHAESPQANDSAVAAMITTGKKRKEGEIKPVATDGVGANSSQKKRKKSKN